MGIFDIFRTKSPAAEPATGSPPRRNERNPLVTWCSERLVDIPSLRFMGQASRSPDGTYLLAWSDADPSQSVSGYRTQGPGRFVLIKGNDVLVQGEIERPNDGKVANTGVFVLNDWLLGDGLKGVFCAFKPTGEQILRHRFEANLDTNGLSDSGEFAVCQTCSSPMADGDKLSLFDLRSASLIWQIEPPTGRASAYHFDVDRGLLGLECRDLGVFNYSFDGTFLDTTQWEEAQIARGQGYFVLQIARRKLEEHGGSLDLQTAAELRRILDTAESRLGDYPGFRAMVERTRAEIDERLGDKQAAIKHYEAALALDPKVGAKSKLAALTGKPLRKAPVHPDQAPREITRLSDAAVAIEVERTPVLQEAAAQFGGVDPGSFIAVDVETANPDVSSICQVGMAAFTNGEQVSSWQTLVNPEDYFDPWNVAIHGINKAMVATAPNFATVFPEIAQRLSGKIVVCHTPFDRSAFDRAIEKSGLFKLNCSWLDSAKVVRRTWPEYSQSGFALAKVTKALGIAFQHHVAAEDARAAGELVVRAIRKTGLSLDDWLKQVQQPVTEARIAQSGDPSGPLAGEVVVFTGTLSRPRAEAAELAARVGCSVAEGVTSETTILVVGDQNLDRLAGHEKSLKQRKAEHLIEQGQEIRIIGEMDFCRIVFAYGEPASKY